MSDEEEINKIRTENELAMNNAKNSFNISTETQRANLEAKLKTKPSNSTKQKRSKTPHPPPSNKEQKDSPEDVKKKIEAKKKNIENLQGHIDTFFTGVSGMVGTTISLISESDMKWEFKNPAEFLCSISGRCDQRKKEQLQEKISESTIELGDIANESVPGRKKMLSGKDLDEYIDKTVWIGTLNLNYNEEVKKGELKEEIIMDYIENNKKGKEELDAVYKDRENKNIAKNTEGVNKILKDIQNQGGGDGGHDSMSTIHPTELMKLVHLFHEVANSETRHGLSPDKIKELYDYSVKLNDIATEILSHDPVPGQQDAFNQIKEIHEINTVLFPKIKSMMDKSLQKREIYSNIMRIVDESFCIELFVKINELRKTKYLYILNQVNNGDRVNKTTISLNQPFFAPNWDEIFFILGKMYADILLQLMRLINQHGDTIEDHIHKSTYHSFLSQLYFVEFIIECIEQNKDTGLKVLLPFITLHNLEVSVL